MLHNSQNKVIIEPVKFANLAKNAAIITKFGWTLKNQNKEKFEGGYRNWEEKHNFFVFHTSNIFPENVSMF